MKPTIYMNIELVPSFFYSERSNKNVLLLTEICFPTINGTGSENGSVFARVTPEDWKVD